MSCSHDGMRLVKDAFHSTARVKAVDVGAVGRCCADGSAVDAPERFGVADESAVGSVAGLATVVAELEFQYLQESNKSGQGAQLDTQ